MLTSKTPLSDLQSQDKTSEPEMNDPSTPSVRVSFESRVVCFLQLFRLYPDGNKTNHATATGFYWSQASRLYLITNRHNVTGLDPESGKPIGGLTPTHINICFSEISGEAGIGAKMTNFVYISRPLYDENDKPLWIEHTLGAHIDVVALPIDHYDWNGKIYTADMKKQMSDFSPMCGDDCYIVGYPESFAGPDRTPIWKRASIATEPEMDYEGKPLFLADSLTRKGMSGSPVFVRISGLWGQEGARLANDRAKPDILGYWTNLIGVYAGREGDEKSGFQLARVWKSSVIEEMIQSPRNPDNPHLPPPHHNVI